MVGTQESTPGSVYSFTSSASGGPCEKVHAWVLCLLSSCNWQVQLISLPLCHVLCTLAKGGNRGPLLAERSKSTPSDLFKNQWSYSSRYSLCDLITLQRLSIPPTAQGVWGSNIWRGTAHIHTVAHSVTRNYQILWLTVVHTELSMFLPLQ